LRFSLSFNSIVAYSLKSLFLPPEFGKQNYYR